MSQASRLAAADTRIVRRDPATGRFVKRIMLPARPSAGELGRNSAGVPGGISTAPVGLLTAGGRDWLPTDAEPHSASIGYALAAEIAGGIR